MEGTTLKTLVENVCDDLKLLKLLCNNYIVQANFVRFLDISDETGKMKDALEISLNEILNITDSIRTKCQLY